MIEVEAKAQINRPEKIRILAQKIARYKGKERKVDDYYTLESLKSYPMKSLRIRKKGNIHQINFKQRLEEYKGIDVKNENEFTINDVEDFLNLLNEFGFKKWLRKEKYTELYEIKNNFHIELNHVKKLGWFVEVEYLVQRKDITRAKKEVLDVLKKLQITKKDLVQKGYTRILWEKK